MTLVDKKEKLTGLYRLHSNLCGEDRVKVSEEIEKLEKEILKGEKDEQFEN